MLSGTQHKEQEKQAPITADQFREQLRKEGVTLKMWAEERDYNAEYCSRVLNGMVKGTRGIGHEIAVAMGIK